MNNPFFMITLATIAGFFLYSMNSKKETRENFWGLPSRSVRVEPEVRVNGITQSIQNPSTFHLNDSSFFRTPNMQSILTPRNQGTADYGSTIRYNLPARQNLAVPADPLSRDLLRNAQQDVRRMEQIVAPTPVTSNNLQHANLQRNIGTCENFVMPTHPIAPSAPVPTRMSVKAPGRKPVNAPVRRPVNAPVRMPTMTIGGPVVHTKLMVTKPNYIVNTLQDPKYFQNQVTSCSPALDVRLMGATVAQDTPSGTLSYMGANTQEHDPATLEIGAFNAMTSDDTMIQPVMYDRYIFSQARSRLRGLGDPIRGDIPIAPANYGWFTPSASPSNDLREGAINVIAGSDNETNRRLANMIYATSGNYHTTIGGINMANQFQNSLGQALADINIVTK